MCRAERPELPCSLQVDFRPLPDQLCTSLRMGSWTPPRHNIINKAWILRLVDHLNSQTRWCRSIQMYHTRVDKLRASYVALVINIKTSLFTPSTFFDGNFEQKYRSKMLRLKDKCEWGKVFPSCLDKISTPKHPKPCILAHTTARWKKPAFLPLVTCSRLVRDLSRVLWLTGGRAEGGFKRSSLQIRQCDHRRCFAFQGRLPYPNSPQMRKN